MLIGSLTGRRQSSEATVWLVGPVVLALHLNVYTCLRAALSRAFPLCRCGERRNEAIHLILKWIAPDLARWQCRSVSSTLGISHA